MIDPADDFHRTVAVRLLKSYREPRLATLGKARNRMFHAESSVPFPSIPRRRALISPWP